MQPIYLGVDAGSITVKAAAIDDAGSIVGKAYQRNSGNPIDAILSIVRSVGDQVGRDARIVGAATTGSARDLAAALIGADIVKNEITAHAVATLSLIPGVQTIIEIGGQESKLIIVRDGTVTDFALNNICAAGTGSFLDHQAARMGISVEALGELAATASSRARISGRCTVFAETDIILKQQLGYGRQEICAGLCDALAEGFLSAVAKGKRLEAPVVFQGGVAANLGMRRAFSERLGGEVLVPEHFAIMGAIGAAMLAMRQRTWESSRFKGFSLSTDTRRGEAFVCDGCENRCEIVKLEAAGQLLAYLGSRCGKWGIPSN